MKVQSQHSKSMTNHRHGNTPHIERRTMYIELCHLVQPSYAVVSHAGILSAIRHPQGGNVNVAYNVALSSYKLPNLVKGIGTARPASRLLILP